MATTDPSRPRPHRLRLAVAGVAALAIAVGTSAAAAVGATGPRVATSTTTSGPAPTTEPVTFTVGILNDVDSLNPFTGIVAEAYEVWGTMYDTLTGYSERDFSPTPRLASSWTTSADGKTWTYTIRSGVTWSDGTPLTAKDVAYTFNRILEGSYEQTNYGSYTANIVSVTAPDDATVVMTTKVPTPIMTRLAVPILPEHVWSKVSAKAVKSYANETDVVGSGPFQLIERKPGQFIRLRANKGYWDGGPKIDELVFRVYANADALAQALKTGEVDIADNLDADVWESLKNTPGVVAYPAKYYGFDEIAFNTGAALDDGTPIGDGHPALKDKRVRVALSYAVDRQTILDRVLNGTGTVGSTVIPPIYADLHLDPATKYTFDPAKANQLLDEAGYTKGSDGVRTMPDGSKPLKLRLFARQESQPSQQTVKFVQGWFKDVGVAVDVKVVAEDNLTEIIGRGEFDMFEWGWVVEPDPDYQLSTFTCSKRSYKDGGDVFANLSDSFYCNKAYDDLYAKQATQTDPAQRAETVKAMQQILHDDAPYIMLYDYDDTQAYRDEWTGFVAQPEGGAVVFQYGTYSYRNVEKKKAAAGDRSADTTSGGISTVVVVGGGVVAAVAVAAGVVALRRRRGDDDRE
ncbi:MAG: ABC transporter substrate-binding protein [Kineosporiaceae bacterium]|jgi:peptide/nickel transport system substrate-binding protein